ncbi:PREDICTED: uncharacterized protein LOC108773404 [Cyphomyrmex costatus]|uniref:uncharacterized protein LOC108773404 n=1 Tax=Cyphomyrmex costatus TaxID=456900 RepID=UPI00085222E6|nr:PREDICTED: uncharacterized protein LOC108773404 [Cyphomyrmex costatus]
MTTGFQRINYGRRRRRKIAIVFAVCKNHNTAASVTVVVVVVVIVVITSMHERTKNDISGCAERTRLRYSESPGIRPINTIGVGVVSNEDTVIGNLSRTWRSARHERSADGDATRGKDPSGTKRQRQ